MSETELTPFIEKKFSQYVEIDKASQNKKVKDLFKLEYLFSYFQSQIKSSNIFIDDVIEENAAIKAEMTEIMESKLQLEQQLKEISAVNQHNGFGGNGKKVSAVEIDSLYDKLTSTEDKLKEREDEIELLKSKIEDQEKTIEDMKQYTQKINYQLDQLRNNEKSYTDDIENLKKEIDQLERAHQKDKKTYQENFYKDFEERLRSTSKLQEQARSNEKRQLLKQIDDLKDKLSRVVSKTNLFLCLNLKGEDDIEAWMKQFDKAAAQYQQAIDAVIPERIKSRNSVVMNIAQVHKEKVGASRLRLQKLMGSQ